MNYYDSFASPKGPAKWFLWSLVVIFLTTLTTFTILEVRSLNSEEPSVIHIILNSLKSANGQRTPVAGEEEQTLNRFVLVSEDGVEQAPSDLVNAIVTEVEDEDKNTKVLLREARGATKPNSTDSIENKNSYYEEQTPVVVYSKTDQEAPLAYRQEAPIPYQQGSHEEQPYYNDDNDDGAYYRPQYEDDSREDFAGPQTPDNDEQFPAEARSSQSAQYDAYYRQWHYVTPQPPAFSEGKASASSSAGSTANRKLSDMTASATGRPRDPYASYLDDYDYVPSHSSPMASQPYHASQQQQLQAYRPPASTQALQQQENESSEMSFLGILKTLKTLWDLYQSFASAWNSMAEHRNKQEELQRQKYKERQQLRTNSRKPLKINGKTKPQGPARTTKKPSTTTTTTTTVAPNTTASTEENSPSNGNDKEGKAKVEPRTGSQGDKMLQKDVEGSRKKRAADTDKDVASSTDMGEGRYIKGDPLKGYYDFVITEGSYKFWAAFQVGTALLIIYSTFAAIYYSKVNPLVSDYDYTDYLGGARSLSGGDEDFVDDETSSGADKGAQHSNKGWFDWMPRSGHSLKFILDAIDKLPVDHDATKRETHNFDTSQKKAM